MDLSLGNRLRQVVVKLQNVANVSFLFCGHRAEYASPASQRVQQLKIQKQG